MPADCCGGKFDLFSQSYNHKSGCPKLKSGRSREDAEELVEEGRKDAFRPSQSSDPSYKLGKKLEEERRVENLSPIIGGRRRR